MSLRHVKPLALIVVLGSMLMFAASGRAAVARDGASAAGAVSLDQPAYTAHESQGNLAITIVRTGDLLNEEHVGYGVKQQDAMDGIDFVAIPNTYITMAPGQSTYTFNVRIIDEGINATPVHALAYLYGSWPDSIGTTNSLVTILHDDPVGMRDAANPLDVPAPAEAPQAKQPAQEPPGRRCDNDLSRLRQALKPGSDVRRVTNHGLLL